MTERQRVRIGDLCLRVTSGGTPSTKHAEYYGGSIPWLRTQEVDFNRITDTEVKITEEGLKNSSAKWIPVNAVIVAMYGATAGRIAIAKVPLTTNQACCNLIVDPQKADYRYVYYALMHNYVELSGRAKGSAQTNLNAGLVKEFEIPDFGLPTQKRIADILSAYDDLIENNRRRMEILEESARLIYRKMFGGKKANGTVAELASANDESYKAGCLPTEINYIDISSVSTGRIDTKTRMTAQNAPGRARRIARHGDVIWSNVRPNLKDYALVLEPEAEDVFSTGFTVLRAKKNLYSYLYLAVTQDKFVSYLEGCVSGATYPAVRPADFLRAEVYVPSEDEGIAFQEYVEPMYDQVRVFAEANRKLAEARDVLLPKLMNRCE